jgi:xylulokinase
MTTSAKRPALLGLDVGTSSVKLLLYFLDAGDRIRLARARLHAGHPRPGWSEMSPDAWWRALRQAAARLDLSDANVLGIGLSTLFPARVALDA